MFFNLDFCKLMAKIEVKTINKSTFAGYLLFFMEQFVKTMLFLEELLNAILFSGHNQIRK